MSIDIFNDKRIIQTLLAVEQYPGKLYIATYSITSVAVVHDEIYKLDSRHAKLVSHAVPEIVYVKVVVTKKEAEDLRETL